MTISNDALLSYARLFFPSLFGSIGSPGTLEIGDTDWAPPMASIAALNDLAGLADGQLIIGASGASALANPSAGPALTASSAGGSLATGAYEVSYALTDVSGIGTTLASPATTITLTSGQTRIAVTAITPLPTGATAARWYVSDAPGSFTMRLHTVTSGGGFNIDAVPDGSNALPPSTNTTAISDHPQKGTPTGSSGIAVTTGPGSLDFSYSPISHVDNNGYYLRRLRIENFITAGLPAGLTTSDKGRLAYDTTVPALKVFDGTDWQLVGSGGGGTTISSGSGSFPPGTTGDLYIRTDLLTLNRYNGSTWDAIGDGTGLSTALADSKVYVGNSSGVATARTISGDGTVSNTGVLAVTKVNGITISGTPSTGYVPTATGSTTATWQAAAGGGSPTFAGVKVTHSADQTTSGGDILIAMDTELYDTNTFHDTSTNNSRITIPTSYGGKYLISCTVWWGSGTAGQAEIYVTKNGVTTGSGIVLDNSMFVSTDGFIQTMTDVILLTAGDYIELRGFIGAGNRTVNHARGPYFSATYLGA